MNKLLLLIPVVAFLAACGSSDGDSGVTTTAATDSQQATSPPIDTFIGDVTVVVGTSSDTAEPVVLDASAASSPEDSEPLPVS